MKLSSKFLLLLFLIPFWESCVVSPPQTTSSTPNKVVPSESSNRPPNLSSTLQVSVIKDRGVQAITTIPLATDPDGDQVSYKLVSFPLRGTLSSCFGLTSTLSSKRSCLYTPSPGVGGKAADTFSVAALDDKGAIAVMKVIIDINENSNPVAVPFTVSILEDRGTQSLGTISPASDVDKDTLSYSVSSLPTKGVVSNCMGLNLTSNTDLICDYLPNTRTDGLDSFTYTVSDGNGGRAVGIVSINIQNTNDNPKATPSTITVNAVTNGGLQTLDLSSIVFSDPDGTLASALTYQVTTNVRNGILVGCFGLPGSSTTVPDVYCRYNPNTGVEGTAIDSFYVTVSDGQGGSVVLSVSITVGNLSPTVETATKTLLEDTANAFTITVSDNGESDITTILGTLPRNNSNAFTGNLTKGVLTSCLGLSGSATSTDTTCVYTPGSNIFGTAVDTFSYMATDLGGKSSTGVITLTVTGVNDAPLISTQSFTFLENSSTASFTVSSASDVDGDALTYSVVTSPALGSLSDCLGISGASSTDLICSYSPVINTYGSPYTTFSAMATDPNGLTSSATMTINVTSSNLAPVFALTSTTMTVAEVPVAPAAAVALSTLPSASDFDALDSLTYSLLTSPQRGTLTSCLNLTSTGALTSASTDLDCQYTPPVNSCGSNVDFFTYQALDNESSTGSARINIDITCNNTAPVATASQRMAIFEMGGIQTLGTIDTATDVDTGPPPDVLSYAVLTSPSKGSLVNCLGLSGTNNSDRSCDYQLSSQYIGTDIVSSDFDTFNYAVTDGQGGSSTQSVIIDVTAINSAPTITNISTQSSTINTGIYAILSRVDEGGAADEDTQSLEVIASSSTTSVIANASINLYYGTSRATAYASGSIGVGGAYRALGDGTSNAGTNYLFIDLVPVTSATGSTTITLNARETAVTSSTATRSFTAVIKQTLSQHEGWTSVVAKGAKVDKNNTVIQNDRTVSFTWSSFTLTSTGYSPSPNPTITAYNVYRTATSSADASFDFGSPLNTSSITAVSRSFTDSSINSASNATLISDNGQVYWYHVLAILSDGTMTKSAQSYSTLRVVVPPKNKALVHRWVANYDICTKIGQTPNKYVNDTCLYGGPGNTSTGYYDLGHDLLVDRFEIGCNYDDSDCDGTADCIGTSTPFAAPVSSSADKIHYNRNTGQCAINKTGTGDWKSIADLTTDAHGAARNSHVTATLDGFANGTTKIANMGFLPPLTLITQLEANNYCTSANFDITINTEASTLTGSPFSGRLMTKKEYIAASSWPDAYGHSTIDYYETGNSLSSSNGCNSDDGGGMSYFDNPASLNIDTYPATSSNPDHRLLRTGATVTTNCVSRYGIQDLVGNVHEWVSDRYYCTNSSTCYAVYPTNAVTGAYTLNQNKDMLINATTPAYDFSGSIGPCADSNADGTCENGSNLDEWVITDKSHHATKYFWPVGLPVDADYPSVGSTPAGLFNVALSASPSMSTESFHSDKIFINAQNLISSSASAVVPVLGGVVVGGGYDSLGAAAGVYTFKVLDSFLYTDKKVGFRCVTPIHNN